MVAPAVWRFCVGFLFCVVVHSVFSKLADEGTELDASL